MACKRSEQCTHGKLCKYANSDSYDILGGSCYKPKKPMTNEEYIRQASTEERAEMLTEMLIKTVYAFDGDIRKVEKKALLVDVFETWLNYKYEESLPMPWEYGFARGESDGK